MTVAEERVVMSRLRASLGMSRGKKRAIALFIDAAICLTCVWLAYYLRLGYWSIFIGNQWLSVAMSLVALPIFWIFGLYRAIFRYAGLEALGTVSRACGAYGVFYASLFTLVGVAGVPRTVGLIQPILLCLLVSGSRAGVGWLLRDIVPRQPSARVLIYGAGASGRQLAAAISGSHEMYLVGFVDDDVTLSGSLLAGKRIFQPRQLNDVISRGVTDIFLAMPSASRHRRREILEALEPMHVKVRTIPGLMDLASGKIDVNALRPLDVEDLLGRDVARPDTILFSQNIAGKTVLVTGAGGSIGSELCRQVLLAHPRRLILVDHSEYALYSIDSELGAVIKQQSCEVIPILASVRDGARLAAVFATWKPDTIYHAAAYKHVPLVEKNVAEGVLNNALGTKTIVEAAIESNVSDFVLISTDKAVRPTNVMGASKRIAELVLQAYAAKGVATTLSMVRFGNVLGSSGSVVPLFRQQIEAGGPVTITHPEVTRYFMTIPEAAQLVIQAGAMANGGEVFVLDMGEPVLIADLARQMIQLSGLAIRDPSNMTGDIEIEVVGLRSGEKLFEELLIGNDPQPTRHPLIMKANEASLPLETIETQLAALMQAMVDRDGHRFRTVLATLVEEFDPLEGEERWFGGAAAISNLDMRLAATG